jgi:hypothetical protein
VELSGASVTRPVCMSSVFCIPSSEHGWCMGCSLMECWFATDIADAVDLSLCRLCDGGTLTVS